MPVIGISVKQLNELLGKTLSIEVLSDTLEQLGCDLDEVTEMTIYRCPQCGGLSDKMGQEEAPKKCGTCGHESQAPFESLGEDPVIRIDLLPARPDFFDPGGLVRAIKGYLEMETGLPSYPVAPAQVEVHVDKSVQDAESFRPFIGCAVVKIPPIDSILLRTLMKLQENLHWGIGRDRKLCSIGIYDMQTVTPPIHYKTVRPDEIQFCPLGKPGVSMTPARILEEHPKGMAYSHLLKPLEKYPLLVDSKGQVLSMPPIINSDETRLKAGSSHLFIDVTGTTESDVRKALDTLTTSIVELGGSLEGVKMVLGEKTWITPDLRPKEIQINSDDAKKWLGIDLKPRDILKYLGKMRLAATGKAPYYKVSYPAFRADIKHEVDIFEDLSIAYGYPNLPMKLVPSMTIGQERPEEKAACLARDIMIGLGFDEIFSLMLTTPENHFHRFGIEKPGPHGVILNPKLVEYNVVRGHLMTGIMESFYQNRHRPVPQKFFEIGNVVLLDEGSDTGSVEEKRVCFGMIGPSAGYAEARSVLDAIFHEMGKEASYAPLVHPSFIEGRCASVSLDDGLTAYLGEVHPRVLQSFGVAYPVAMAELTLARLFQPTGKK